MFPFYNSDKESEFMQLAESGEGVEHAVCELLKEIIRERYVEQKPFTEELLERFKDKMLELSKEHFTVIEDEVYQNCIEYVLKKKIFDFIENKKNKQMIEKRNLEIQEIIEDKI